MLNTFSADLAIWTVVHSLPVHGCGSNKKLHQSVSMDVINGG